jgi:transposase
VPTYWTYEAREDFYAVWEPGGSPAAKEAYGAWTRQLHAISNRSFGEPTTAMSNGETEIFAYFDRPITNAYTESLIQSDPPDQPQR